MKSSFFVSLALGLSWLLCPESLVIIGNTTGRLGWMILPFLVGVTLVFTVGNRLLAHSALPSGIGSEFFILSEAIGKVSATALSFASSLPLVVLVATGLLVTSGYTFNEVFLYTFPNFGFAFLLLFFLTILQLFPEKIIHRALIWFTIFTAGGLLILGLYGAFNPVKSISDIVVQPSHFISASPLLLLVLVGTTLFREDQPSFFLVPLVGIVLLLFWILASLGYVTPERLADSTIPYMTASRKILGELGRQIMGGVVISGTCAVITGLLLLSRRMLANVANEKMAPGFLSGNGQHRLLPLLLGGITGVLLATGFAGDILLEVFLRGSLILRLFYYSVLCFSAALWLKKKSHEIPLSACIAILFLITGSLSLILGNHQRSILSLFILGVLGTSWLLATGWYFKNNK